MAERRAAAPRSPRHPEGVPMYIRAVMRSCAIIIFKQVQLRCDVGHLNISIDWPRLGSSLVYDQLPYSVAGLNGKVINKFNIINDGLLIDFLGRGYPVGNCSPEFT